MMLLSYLSLLLLSLFSDLNICHANKGNNMYIKDTVYKNTNHNIKERYKQSSIELFQFNHMRYIFNLTGGKIKKKHKIKVAVLDKELKEKQTKLHQNLNINPPTGISLFLISLSYLS